jgi:hypothetical protein
MQRDSSNKDHVIGQKFVPTGALNGCWNLLVRSCRKCNSEKSYLENDISAITLNCLHRFGTPEQASEIRDETARKVTGSVSRMTHRPVAESEQELSASGMLAPGAEISFGMVAPPQIDGGRVFQLARLHLMAFFYLITYDRAAQRGRFWPGSCAPINYAHLRDWGNQQQRWFMSVVSGWDDRCVCITANGFFKVAIRRNPNAECWAWALEWNKSYRVIGFFGALEPIKEFARTLPPLVGRPIGSDSESIWTMREEVPLDDQDDILFDCSDKAVG